MFITLIMILTIIFLPRFIVLATNKVPLFNTLGAVFLCYLAGLLLSFLFNNAGADISLAADISSILVCISMPLILFSADLPALKKLAKPMLISYGMNGIAVLILAVIAFFIFRGVVPVSQNVSAMLVGDYIGGTPNIFAIGKSMGSTSNQIILLETTDIIVGGLYFFMLISFMPRLLKKFLPEYQWVGIVSNKEETQRYEEEFSGKKQTIKPFKAFLSRLGLVLISIGCVAVAMGICLLIPSAYGNTGLAKIGEFTAVIMIVVTTLGIALSFVKKIRNAPGSYSTGQYFILMFSVAMGLCFDFSAITGALALFVMLLFVQFGSVILHLIFAKIGKIDYHTMMITSTAGIFGPAFIMPVAKALNNDEIILPGILCGILGLAVSNYIGIGIGWLLNLFA